MENIVDNTNRSGGVSEGDYIGLHWDCNDYKDSETKDGHSDGGDHKAHWLCLLQDLFDLDDDQSEGGDLDGPMCNLMIETLK